MTFAKIITIQMKSRLGCSSNLPLQPFFFLSQNLFNLQNLFFPRCGSTLPFQTGHLISDRQTDTRTEGERDTHAHMQRERGALLQDMDEVDLIFYIQVGLEGRSDPNDVLIQMAVL